ncbi:menaquinone biosynthesis protein [Paenibacillus sp. DMB20]|uniref:menaquinone biosynthesis protein n=1 Tax=Paenibacillus sp. DMB20 TaxID=1642570 RepID=UPI000627C27A|nr:menaquinone biosynthesis protein [Paenibacillus sp. DMB20]KKO52003.1 ABC transporter substrate-binding protein [Paenibacillus sp. DMB20]
MPNNDRKTVIGKISYTNAWPLFYYVDPGKLDFPAEMVTEVPAVLNEGMKKGNIQIGAISSFSYAEAADRLLLLPDLSVSADGEVKSILLFSRGPVETLAGGTIALTNTSATSVNLLKILMQKALGGSPAYITMEPDLEAMMESADAALLIGDNAIRASWHNRDYHVTDLSKWWKEWTGYSMTFAVWAVNRGAAAERPGDMADIAALFEDSKRRSLSDLRPIVNAAVSTIGGTEPYWKGYFTNLCYDFDDRKREGLRLYFKYAYELGLLSQDVVPELWSDTIRMQVKE